jgi:hypothetical protein
VLLLITYANELGDVGVEDLDVLHKLIQAVPGVQDTKFGEDAHVASEKLLFHITFASYYHRG